MALVGMAAGVVALAAAPAGAQDALSGSEIRRTISGKSGSWVTGDKQYSGSTTWAAGGTLSGSVKTGDSVQPFTGRWEVRGNRLCETISIDPEGTRCHQMVKLSGSSYRLVGEDGRPASTVTVR